MHYPSGWYITRSDFIDTPPTLTHIYPPVQHKMAGGYGYGSGRGSNPFDYDDENGGFGSGNRGQRSYDRTEDVAPEDLEFRKQMAVRRMEESSANSLRTLNETYRMGVDTTVELDNQAESLDRVERRLDEIHVDLEKGKRNLRLIKSPFGGIANYFSKRKSVKEVTDPKDFKPQPSSTRSSKSTRSSAKHPSDSSQLKQFQSTGSEVVDSNLDEMSKQLDRLMGVGELIGTQLDDSEVQIDRVKYKMDRDEGGIQALNRDIKRQL